MPHTMSISFDKFMEILEEKLPVYGDFLRFYKIELGLLPISKGTPLFRVGSLCSRLKDMHCGMMHAYAMLAMFKRGFVDLPMVEIAKQEEEKDEGEAFEFASGYMREMGVEETIYGWLFGEGLLGIFINTENPKEAIHVLGVCTDFYEFSFNKKDEINIKMRSADELIEKLNKDKDEKSIYIDSSSVERISDFIIKCEQDYIGWESTLYELGRPPEDDENSLWSKWQKAAADSRGYVLQYVFFLLLL